MKDVYILAHGRTPIGSLLGELCELSAVELASQCAKGVLDKYNINPDWIDEMFLGNVISANLGQAPAKQIAYASGLSKRVPCTLVNKVCASGMKAIVLGAQSIQLGINDMVMVGGAESMSNAPHYLQGHRNGYKYGNSEIFDALVKDGLQDPTDQKMMGSCAEICAENYNISKEEQDEYSLESYRRARIAYRENYLENEIIPMQIVDRKGKVIVYDKDEEVFNHKVNVKEDFNNLKTVFKKDGTVTAGNSSKINDGASILVLGSLEIAEKYGLTPLVKIEGYADASQESAAFTTTPALAIPKALKMANIDISEVDYFEINEAFAVVPIANMRILDIPHDKTNIWGGAVSMGHPLGCSGARIVSTLINILSTKKANIGVAGICNGGGGATALVLKNV